MFISGGWYEVLQEDFTRPTNEVEHLTVEIEEEEELVDPVDNLDDGRQNSAAARSFTMANLFKAYSNEYDRYF